MSNWPLLSLLIWLPILGGLFTLACGNARPSAARWVALGSAVVIFLISLLLLSGFDFAAPGLQFLERREWIPAFDIQYHLGADGISAALIVLTTLTTALVLIGAWTSINTRVSQYFAAMLILEGMMIGVFSAVDAMLFYVFFEAMLIPMFPVHTWLPDAHVEAPTGGSVILAAIMLKIGGYGFIRFSLPIVPDAGQEWAWLMIMLSLIAVVYVGLVALVQNDMKKLIAYSSVSHMGFVTLGIFLAFVLVRGGDADAARLGLQGAMVQMISHGFISGAMFSCVGILYDRMHTRRIRDYGGVATVMPWFAAFFVLFSMANSGLPGTSGFVGEFMVIMASFQANPLIAFAAALPLIIGASYSLWLVKRIFYGEVSNAHVAGLKDINGREALVLGVFAAGVLGIGIWPMPLTNLMEPSIAQLAELLTATKL